MPTPTRAAASPSLLQLTNWGQFAICRILRDGNGYNALLDSCCITCFTPPVPVFSGEHRCNGSVSVCLSVPSIDSSSDVPLLCRSPDARAQKQAGSVSAVIIGGSTQTYSVLHVVDDTAN